MYMGNFMGKWKKCFHVIYNITLPHTCVKKINAATFPVSLGASPKKEYPVASVYP